MPGPASIFLITGDSSRKSRGRDEESELGHPETKPKLVEELVNKIISINNVSTIGISCFFMLSIILKARLQFYANKNCIITAILNEKKYQNKLKLIAPPHNTS
jgi:hypothetical protein